MKVMMLCLFMLSIAGDIDSTEPRLADDRLVFEGTVLRMAKYPNWVSGFSVAYRLAKYRVERVCEGKYDGKEVVVDHLIISGDELRDIKTGDKVCVCQKGIGDPCALQRRRDSGANRSDQGVLCRSRCTCR